MRHKRATTLLFVRWRFWQKHAAPGPRNPGNPDQWRILVIQLSPRAKRSWIRCAVEFRMFQKQYFDLCASRAPKPRKFAFPFFPPVWISRRETRDQVRICVLIRRTFLFKGGLCAWWPAGYAVGGATLPTRSLLGKGVLRSWATGLRELATWRSTYLPSLSTEPSPTSTPLGTWATICWSQHIIYTPLVDDREWTE